MMNEDAEDSQRRSTFHLDEFKFLKTEMIEDTKAAAFNFRFALITSGALAAWVVEHQPINLVAASFPCVVSISMFGLNWGIQTRSAHRDEYLERLEPYLAWPGFGYEINGKPRKPKSLIELTHYYWAKFPFRRLDVPATEDAIDEKTGPESNLPRFGRAEAICWVFLLTFSIVFFLMCLVVVLFR